jgi:type I restriction-modification system DNA methylase subunit
VPTVSGKEKFFAKLETLVAEARRLKVRGFDEQEPEEATKQLLLEPLLQALGFTSDSNYTREFKIIGDSVDYLLKSDRPLIFVEAKSLLDKAENLFTGHREQVQRYIRNYRVSPEQVRMERPVAWIVLTNFAQFHFIRVNEETPTFSFALDDLWKRREEFWDLLALESLETGRIEELYEQRHKAGLDQRFLADLKRWRLLLVNGFALRNQTRSLDDITHASQQLLNRFLFSRMLETNQLIEWNKLARAYSHYEVFHGDFTEKTFAESLRESLFQEIKFKFNTELFKQPLLCDTLALDNNILSILVGHEPLSPDVAATCGFESGQGELIAFRHLYSYDFSLMSSDVMGAVYEKFLAHKLAQKDGRIVVEDTDELRKKEGIYYTPRYIVDYIVAHTLGEKINPILAEAKALLGYKNFKGAYDKICELSQIKVLDPAMGSGSFLLGAFDALAAAYSDYNAECEKQKRNGGNGDGNGDALFDAPAAKPRPVERLGTAIVTHNLFGVDLDAQAVEVAKLNLWIRLMAAEKDSLRMKLQDPNKGKVPQNLLPALAANFKRGNSLIDDAKVAGDAAFDWAKEFPEIVAQASSLCVSEQSNEQHHTGKMPVPLRHGFDVVIGNPPYVYTRNQGFTESEKEFYNSAFKHQSIQLNTFGLFIEHAANLLCNDGVMGFITPNNWLTIDTFAPLRKFALESCGNLKFFNNQERVFESADVDTAIVLFEKHKPTHLVVGELKNGVEVFNRQVELTDIKPPNFIIQISLLKNAENQGMIDKIEPNSKRLSEYAVVSTGLKVYQVGKGKPVQTKEQKENRSFHSLKKEKATFGKYLEGQDVTRYELGWSGEYLNYGDWIAEPRKSVPFSGARILVRQIPANPPYLVHAVYTEQDFYNDINSMVIFKPVGDVSLKFLLGVINSRLMSFWFEKTFDKLQRKIFPQFKVDELGSFPIRVLALDKKADKTKHDKIVLLVDERLSAQTKSQSIPLTLLKKIHHSNRTVCNLSHYLQKDFAAAVTEEKLIDDVQRTGFVHEIRIESNAQHSDLECGDTSPLSPDATCRVVPKRGHARALQSGVLPEITFIANISDTLADTPRPLPVLRLTFKDEALRQFIYASWRQFLNENSRKQKWTKGKKPEPIYPLLVNTLEPLVYFNASAGDNLRAIRDLMKAVAEESGSADLAAIESEIKQLDTEIDQRVYDLYGLTPEEIKIVEGAAK